MFPKRIKALRLKNGYTQAQLGEAVGFKQTTIASYESGTNRPSIEVLNRFADFFGVTLDYLVGRVDDPLKTSLDLFRALGDIPDLSKPHDKEEVTQKIREVLHIKDPFIHMTKETKELLDLYHQQVDITARALELLLGKMAEKPAKDG